MVKRVHVHLPRWNLGMTLAELRQERMHAMKGRLRLPITLALTYWLCLWPPAQTLCQGKADPPILEIATGDTAVTICVRDYDGSPALREHDLLVIDRLRQAQVPLIWAKSLLLELARRAYLHIPFWLFRSAEMVEGQHLVTLADGSQYEGMLQGLVRDSLNSEAPEFNMAEAQTVSLLNECPVHPDLMMPVVDGPVWRLHVQNPLALDCGLTQPRFEHAYWSSAGYLVGGATRSVVTERFKILQDGKDAMRTRLPEVLRLTTREAPRQKDIRAKPSREEEDLLKQVAGIQWLQTTSRMSLSPDRRYMAWTNSSTLQVLQVGTGILLPVLQQATMVSDVCFLPGEEPILAVKSDKCFLVDVASGSVISGAPASRVLADKEPGAKLYDAKHANSLRALPGGLYASWWTDGLCIWKWRHTTVSQLLEASKTIPENSDERLGLPCELVGHVRFDPWELDWPHQGYGLVSRDAKWLLIPVWKELPTKERSPNWMLVDISKPEAPSIKGVVPDWLSESSFNALHDAVVLAEGKRRGFPDGVPVCLGTGGIMTLGRYAGELRLVDPESGSVCAKWSPKEVGRLRLFPPVLRYLEGFDLESERPGTTISVELMDGTKARGLLYLEDDSREGREAKGWQLSGYLPGSAVRLSLTRPTCTLERLAGATAPAEQDP